MNAPDSLIGPINLGNPIECTINELAEKIIELINCTGRLTYVELPENDPVRRQPDISLAKKMLDWQPTIQLDAGLKQTIDYFRDIVSDIKEIDIEITEKYRK